MDFEEQIKEAVDRFRQLPKSETIRVVSHLDSDGICAAAIIVKALSLENYRYSISIVQQIDEKVARELAAEEYKYFFFTDIGSGQLKLIAKHLGDRTIFVLDHHEPENVKSENIVHVNPHLSGIDGSKQVSGAGVVYLFAEQLNPRMKQYAHVAVIGAIGDIQENNGFSEINKKILETAKQKGNIKEIKGLRLFGVQTKPLHKVLEYCTDPYIPGVTGSESGAIQFLRQIGVEPKDGNKWRKLVHLSDAELKKLAEGIIMRRLDENNPEEILGPVYILKNEEKESPLRDAKEFSTLLNACGRMGKASIGIGACLGDEKIKKIALRTLKEYKKEIIKALRWYNSNKQTDSILIKKGYVLINAQDYIMPTIIGTLASIVSKSNEYKEGTFIMSMAQLYDGNTKISLRIAGSNPNGTDLHELISEIVEKVGTGNAGGHMDAAGGLIPTEKEQEFIEISRSVLSRVAIEEKV